MKKGKYKCKKCGYSGDKFVFQFNDYAYCIASNDEEPEFVNRCPEWVFDRVIGSAEIGNPVGCLECHAWGISEFEIVG